MTYALYYSKYCYFCQKVLMLLRKSDHAVDLRDVSDQTHQAALVSGGGKGQVPCLRISAPEQPEQWLYESDDIIHYLRQHGLTK